MQAAEFESALKRQPFTPFRVRYESGQSLVVSHPEWVFISPGGRTAHIYTNDDPVECHIIDVMLIETIEPLSNGHGRSGGGNGGGPKRKR